MSENETQSGPPCVAVVAQTDDERDRAAALAKELRLPIAVAGPDGLRNSGPSLGHRRGPTDEIPDLLLLVRKDRLELREARRRALGPMFVDFVRGPTGYRRRSNLSRRQAIAAAVGLRHGPVTVVDATAGLGRDAFLLACLGCTVTAVERCAILGALLRDGLARAAADGGGALREIVKRIRLVIDDAYAVLSACAGAGAPDVVYLDPMYPPKKKTALPSKEMRLCRRLVGDDPDAAALLALARRVAKKRTVVKRYRHAPPLAPRPVIQYAGKQVRYDVYPGPASIRGVKSLDIR